MHTTASKILLIAFCLVSTSLSATQVFPQTHSTDELVLQKRGEYRYLYRMFFKLYDAALFTTKNAKPSEILAAKVPFHLNFKYLRTIEKSIILKSASQMLERNLSAAELKSISDRVNQINRAYSTVGKGDSSLLTYIPEVGTTLRINDKPVITIEGQDFAQLYFQIWLGEKPISEPMKTVLIGTE
ncbi:MAG: chalcone isomerase family protein [Opitutaceae bacterium]